MVMQTTCNITFVVNRHEEDELVRYLRSELLPTLVGEDRQLQPQLKKVIESGGEPLSEEHGCSLALSLEFPAESAAKDWFEHKFLSEAGFFYKRFPEGVFFMTLLQNIDI